MRWTTVQAVHGERVRSWFALWPVRINGETRWLERVAVEQTTQFIDCGNGRLRRVWLNYRFVDPESA